MSEQPLNRRGTFYGFPQYAPCRVRRFVLTYFPQFCERVQLDSIVYNELGHPDDLISEASGDIDEFKALPRFATF